MEAKAKPASIEEGADVAVRARETFCVSGGRDCAVGDVLKLPASRARRLIALGWAEAVTITEGGSR